jgi:hypothetical protein
MADMPPQFSFRHEIARLDALREEDLALSAEAHRLTREINRLATESLQKRRNSFGKPWLTVIVTGSACLSIVALVLSIVSLTITLSRYHF